MHSTSTGKSGFSWLPVRFRSIRPWIRILLACLAVAVGGIFWFRDIASQNLHMDEIAWVLDSSQYRQWRSGNRDAFVIAPGRLPWSHPKYRIVDQPFFGKRVYGWYLERIVLLDTWPESKARELYSRFSTLRLPTDLPPDDSHAILSPEVARAVVSLRYFTATVGFLVILLFSFVVAFIRKRPVAGLTMYLLLMLHPIIRNTFRLALPHPFEIGFSLGAMFLLFIGFGRGIPDRKRLPVLCAGAVCTACAADTKLSSLALLVVPWIIGYIQSPRLGRFLRDIGLFLLLVGAVLWYIEPVIRMQPLTGFQALLSARMEQQASFRLLPTGIPLSGVPLFFLRVAFRMGNWLESVLFVLAVLLGTGVLLERKNRLELFICLYLLASGFSYLTAGFWRYALNGVFVCIYVAGFAEEGISHWLSRLHRRFHTLIPS